MESASNKRNLAQIVSELLSHANEDIVTSRYVKRSTFTHIVHLLQKCRIQNQSLCLRQPPKKHVVQRQIPGASTYTSGYIPRCILLVFRAGVECQEFTQAQSGWILQQKLSNGSGQDLPVIFDCVFDVLGRCVAKA